MGLFPIDDPRHEAVYAEEAAMVDASEILAEALEASKVSRADLARRLGVSRSEVTNRLQGERNITVRKLAATLHALGHSLTLSTSPAEPREPEPEEAFVKWRRVTSSDHEAMHRHHLPERVMARMR